MAGGIGSRFWPESRPEMPKQFIDILGVGKTLIQQTFDRFAKIISQNNIFVVSSDNYLNIIKEQLPLIPEKNILTEPMRRNTAPCILYAALKINGENKNAKIIVSPADHLILEEDIFLNDINESLEYADNDVLITLGINPNRPATTYGYIKSGLSFGKNNFYKVENFTEKPNLDTAKKFLDDGNYLWNAGIFIWQNKNIIKAISKYLPEITEIFNKEIDFTSLQNEKNSINKIYSQIEGISIDYGVMEKADNVVVKKTNFSWSDLGTWNSIYSLKEKDCNDNVIISNNVIAEDVKGCFIKSTSRKTIVLKDLENFICIDTADILLICKRENEQEITKLSQIASNKKQ